MQTVLKVAGNLFVALGLATLAACGGGGGDSPAMPAVAPVITSQPANATVTEGNTAQFSVTATGTAPLTYQWRRNGAAIAGATAPCIRDACTNACGQHCTVQRRRFEHCWICHERNGRTYGQRPALPELSLLAGTFSGSGYFDGPVLPLDLARHTRSHSMQRVTLMSRTLEIM